MDWNGMEHVLVFSLRNKYMRTEYRHSKTALVIKSLQLISCNSFIAGLVKIN